MITIPIEDLLRIVIDHRLHPEVEILDKVDGERRWERVYGDNLRPALTALARHFVAQKLADGLNEHAKVERFDQPFDVAEMIGCDDSTCSENAKVKVRFKSTRVRYYCREGASRVTGVPVMELP